MDYQDYELLCDVYEIVEWKDGAVFKTKLVERDWFPYSYKNKTKGNFQYFPAYGIDVTDSIRKAHY